ncbi:type II secretion system F family protein [Benzoatithermus flavus]|uniref:Type II secretion system F family protein n=1 Tax=Benzoatithermus flavus TaxID=3108223 RepID=A0ABU8XNS3_9PROT
MTPGLLMLLGILAAIGLALLVLDRAVTRRDRIRARLIRACGKESDHGTRTPATDGLPDGEGGLLDALADRLARPSLLGSRDQTKMRELLLAAGFRDPSSLGRYVAVKALAMAAGAFLGLGLMLRDAAGEPVLQLALAGVLAFVAGLLPELGLKLMRRRRQNAIRATLADALDLMIIAANAGHSLDVAVARVGKEIAHMAPVLADELAVLGSEMRALPNRRQALENLAQRTGLPEVRSLTATLIQTIRYGTPLTQALKTLALEMRQAKLLLLEERAARLPALLSLPLMLLIMPSIFIVTVGPAIIRISALLFE